MESAIHEFRVIGRPVDCQLNGSGHINQTRLIRTDAGRRYILQRINRHVFPDIDKLMENIFAVTRFVAARVDDPRKALTLVPTKDGGAYYRDGEGECWRVYDYVEDGVCLQAAGRPEDFYESAIAFGTFQNMLSDFQADTLHETIRDFHNTPVRYQQFLRVLEEDPLGRAAGVEREIDFVLERQPEAGALQQMRESGQLPLRVTHNDTKLNNVILDALTHKALCVIDLDTVMPGLAAYDYGDSIRFGAATAAEDERELSRVSMSLTLFDIYTRGFLQACPSLTAAEIETLPLGAKLMTLECGMRFLADYLDGDHYYAVARPEHNLDRARTQLALVADMERQWDGMRDAVERERRALRVGSRE